LFSWRKTEGIGSLSQPREAGKKTGQPILDAISPTFNRVGPEAVRKGLGDWRVRKACLPEEPFHF